MYYKLKLHTNRLISFQRGDRIYDPFIALMCKMGDINRGHGCWCMIRFLIKEYRFQESIMDEKNKQTKTGTYSLFCDRVHSPKTSSCAITLTLLPQRTHTSHNQDLDFVLIVRPVEERDAGVFSQEWR